MERDLPICKKKSQEEIRLTIQKVYRKSDFQSAFLNYHKKKKLIIATFNFATGQIDTSALSIESLINNKTFQLVHKQMVSLNN